MQLEEADKKIEKINPEEYDALSDRIICDKKSCEIRTSPHIPIMVKE